MLLLGGEAQGPAPTRKDAVMSDLNPQPLPPRVVSVEIPYEVYTNLGKFQEVQRSIFDLLGCTECNSGFQFDWKHYSRFVVSPDLKVQPVQQFG